jgi:hypothetical protein
MYIRSTPDPALLAGLAEQELKSPGELWMYIAVTLA